MKIKNKILVFISFAVFTLGSITAAFAAGNTYSFSDLDIELEIPSELIVFTRTVTDSDPNLSILGVSADDLRLNFQKNNIYLETFPEDVSYEIILSGKEVSGDVKDFDKMDDTQLNDGLSAHKTKYELSETEEINSVTLYQNDSASFYVIDSKTTSDPTVYIRKYYTVMQGKEIAFTLQTNKHETLEEQTVRFKSIVDSAIFKEVKSSISESLVFTEIMQYMIGMGLTIAILGFLVFMMDRVRRKKKSK